MGTGGSLGVTLLDFICLNPPTWFIYLFIFAVSLQTRDRIGSGGPVVDCRGLLENDGYVFLQQHCIVIFRSASCHRYV